MPQSIVHLPNGQTLTVQPVFGGLYFKSNDLQLHHSAFPPGWTIILNSEDDEEDHNKDPPTATTIAHTNPNIAAVAGEPNDGMAKSGTPKRAHHIHRFRKPSLQNDHLFISSISNPSSSEFKPSSSPTRSIAMMLWATLWWYFHQPEPSPYLTTPASAGTPEEARPRGEWRVNINREGIFKGKHLLPKLERMGLIASEDSSVGLDPEDGVGNAGEGWTKMFVSRKSFWQMDARIYLFTLSPTSSSSPFPSVSPASSRPASPNRGTQNLGTEAAPLGPLGIPSSSTSAMASALNNPPPHPLSRHNTPPGPYQSTSHLPTFYPPAPLQYTFTNGIRHPVRPKPPRQGETFYTRYIPSLGQYLSFRVASLSKTPCVHRGPSMGTTQDIRAPRQGSRSDGVVPTIGNMSLKDGQGTEDTAYMTDTQLLHKWMNLPRVSDAFGQEGPVGRQSSFLANSLASKHSFPCIGSFDGKPFGYFEIYWVKEDSVAPYLHGQEGAGNYER